MKFAYDRYYCKNFRTTEERAYQCRVVNTHPGKPCYSSKVNLERLGVQAQGRLGRFKKDIKVIVMFLFLK